MEGLVCFQCNLEGSRREVPAGRQKRSAMLISAFGRFRRDGPGRFSAVRGGLFQETTPSEVPIPVLSHIDGGGLSKVTVVRNLRLFCNGTDNGCSRRDRRSWRERAREEHGQ
jgi:hypothetical protein